MYDLIIGMDNGISANGICIRTRRTLRLVPLPIKKCRDYQESKECIITRIDLPKLINLLAEESDGHHPLLVIERPLRNPRMFRATVSGCRAYEACIGAADCVSMACKTISPKDWQQYIPNLPAQGPKRKEAISYWVRRHSEFINSNICASMDMDPVAIALLQDF